MKEQRIAYLDCFSGVSGDMLLASLLDAGASLERINEILAALNIGCAVERVKESLSGITASRVKSIHLFVRFWPKAKKELETD